MADSIPAPNGVEFPIDRLERLERIVGLGTGNGLQGDIKQIDSAMLSVLREVRNARHASQLRERLRREEEADWHALQEAWHEIHSDNAIRGRLWSGFLAMAVLAGILVSKLV